MSELSDVLETLRALVQTACDRAEVEPRAHVRLLLAEHAETDAASLAGLDELGVAAGEPVRLEGVEDAYERARPELIARLAALERTTDALADEATLQALIRIRHDQERHLVELPVSWSPPENAPDDEQAAALRAEAREIVRRVRTLAARLDPERARG